MNTKQLILMIMVVFVALEPVTSITPEQIEKMAKGMRSTCLQKIDVSEDLVAGIRQGKFPDDPNLKCYTHCIMKIMRSIKNGAIDFNAIIKQIEMTMPANVAPRLKDAVNKCSERTFSGDLCEIAFEYTKCCYEMDPEIFFFP